MNSTVTLAAAVQHQWGKNIGVDRLLLQMEKAMTVADAEVLDLPDQGGCSGLEQGSGIRSDPPCTGNPFNWTDRLMAGMEHLSFEQVLRPWTVKSVASDRPQSINRHLWR